MCIRFIVAVDIQRIENIYEFCRGYAGFYFIGESGVIYARCAYLVRDKIHFVGDYRRIYIHILIREIFFVYFIKSFYVGIRRSFFHGI